MNIKIHPWRDVRWWAVTTQTIILVLAILTKYLPHTWATVFACLATTILIDAVMIRWKWGHWELPLGATSAAYSCLFFIRPENNFYLYLAAATAILQKYIFRFNGRHIFNPSNFGIVFVLVFFSTEILAQGSRWGTTLLYPAVVILLGVPVLWNAGRLPLTLSLFLFTFTLAPLRAILLGGSPYLFAMIGASTSFILSFFLMCTDPSTSPKTLRGQILFALSIVLIDQTLRQYRVIDSLLYAIFIVTACVPAVKLLHSLQTNKSLPIFRHWSMEKV